MTLCILLFIVLIQITLASERIHFGCSTTTILVVVVVQGGGLGDHGVRCYSMTLCILLFIVHTQITLASESIHFSCSSSSTSSPRGWCRTSTRAVLPHE